VVVLVPALGQDVVLLVLTPTVFLIAVVVGFVGVALVELVDRLAGRPAARYDVPLQAHP
jgi:hypothetical protein